MKLSNVAGSSLLALVIAMPSAMAANGIQEKSMEQRVNPYMEQSRENQDMNGKQHQNRYQIHKENKAQYKDMYQNRLREKQESGFRMKSGSGGR